MEQAVSVQPRLIFPIEHADLGVCLFAHKKFADVSVEQTDEVKDGVIKSWREMFNGFKVIMAQTVRRKALLIHRCLYLI